MASHDDIGLEPERPLCCIRCGTVLLVDHGCDQPAGVVAEASDAIEIDDEFPALPPFDACEQWELEQELRHVARLLAMNGCAEAPHDAGHSDWLRHDGPPPIAAYPVASRAESGRWGRLADLAAWSMLAIGLAASSGGGVLAAWGYTTARNDLWDFGMPIALGGQVCLLGALFVRLALVCRDPQPPPEPTRSVPPPRLSEGRRHHADLQW